MRIAIFGATGAVGRRVVTQAANRGHGPIAIVRPQSSERVRFPGSAEERTADVYRNAGVAEALEGCDVVISCLGIRRRNRFNPWSPLRSPSDLTQIATRHILNSMQAIGLSRIACISAAGVGDSFPGAAAPIRFLIRHSNMAPAYRDLERMEQQLLNSEAEWLAVRPTTLTSVRTNTAYHAANRYGLFSHIARNAVAAALLDFMEGKPGTPAGANMISG